MNNRYSIRISTSEKEALQAKARSLGYRSSSDLARILIQNGLSKFELKKSDEHALFNSVQTVLLLRELINMLAGDEEKSQQIIHSIKHSAELWLDKFKNAVGE